MTTDPTHTPETDDAHYRDILRDLIDRGADLARRIHEAATATPGTPPDADIVIAFDRITRTVRRTIALARHIADGPAQTQTPKQARTATREKLIRGVEDAIHRRRKETDAEALYAELHERLDDPELERDIQGRPVEDIIEEICRDLSVAVQGRSWVWRRRTPADIAALRARAEAPAANPFHVIHGGKPGPRPTPAPPTPYPNAERPR